MSRRTFATIDALLALACTVIFAGGVLAQSGERSGERGTPPRREPPVEQIAADLGIPADRVREAFRKVGPPTRSEQPPTQAQLRSHAQALAAAMNVPTEKLIPVLEKYRPAPPAQRGGSGGDKS